MSGKQDLPPQLGLLGESSDIVSVRESIARLFSRLTDTSRLPPLLIQGETGTGKGLLARAIHRVSARRHGPFIDVNCAAIPESLLEAELFGYERGAFTDARHAKAGLFQAAHRGTIFLDELGLLPASLQGKLLTVIEDRAVRRLGSTRNEPVDVWILAATGSDLEAAMRSGRFHDALYHRLSVLTLRLPPLRERGADVMLLAEHFLARACRDHGLGPKRLHESARAALQGYAWPGNVRELANVMERVALLEESAVVTAAMLGLDGARAARSAAPDEPGWLREAPGRLRARVAGLEREEIAEALRQTLGNITHAAMRLGIPANTLRYRIQKHGLSPRSARPARARSKTHPGAGAALVSSDVVPAAVMHWESRLVAVLHAAILSEGGAPALPQTTRAIQMLVEKIASFGGRVEDLAPGAIVAAFGVEPMEDAPRRAALAARAIQSALIRSRDEEPSPWGVRLGVHVESFLVGQLGGVGPTLDLDTKRRAWGVLEALVGAAKDDDVLLSPEAARLLDRRFELSPSGLIEGAGRVWRLGGGERTGLGLHGQLRGLVGRGEELRRLHQLVAATLAGRGAALTVAGEPGIGKSRLLYELRRHAEVEGLRYVEGRCVPHGRPVSYLPIARLVRQLFDITDADTAEVLIDKVRQGIGAVGLEPRERVPLVLALLGAETDAAPDGLHADVLKARAFEVLRQLLVAASWRCPLVAAVEDCHWSDAASEELLSALAGSLAGAPILLVATYRAGHRPPWSAAPARVEITLEPLSREESRAVLRATLDADKIPDSLVELILLRAEGNPFFLEELARAVVENPDLPVARTTPITIREVLLSRIDRLLAEDRRLLQCAAVIGKDVPLSLLEAVAGLGARALAPPLARLCAAQLLREGASPSEPGYAFKHVLTQEAAYSTLGADERRLLHRRAVEAIETTYPGRLVEHLDQLAHHVVRGEVWEKALSYLPGIGTEQQGYADDPAIGPGVGPAFAGGSRQWAAGQHAQAVERAQVELRIATDFRNFEGQLVSHLQLGQAYHSLGDDRQAVEMLSRNVTMLLGELRLRRFELLPGLPAILSLAWLALAQAGLDQAGAAEASAREAAAMAEAAGSDYDRAIAGWAAGTVALRRGDVAAAVVALAGARDRAREEPARELFLLIGAPLGLALARAGKLDEATAVLAEWGAMAQARPVLADQSQRVAWHAEAEQLAGRLDRAEALARRAVALAQTHSERRHEAHALATLAAVAAHVIQAPS
ncbi:MAG TPA: sigma 54-interacting transcriptional regulator [Solirubrobacterales bacterium]|nr:sigma 54-interacting transcriptional regulator [Solirubrobacterales bacterium]